MMQPLARLVRKPGQINEEDIVELLYSCLPPLFADRDFFIDAKSKEKNDEPVAASLVSRQQQLMMMLSKLLKNAYEKFTHSQSTQDQQKESIEKHPPSPPWTEEHSWRSRLQGVAAGVADHPMVECEPAINGPAITALLQQVECTHAQNYRNGQVTCNGSWHWQKTVPDSQPTKYGDRPANGTAHGRWVTGAIAALGAR